ncbi:MAG: hypothetical protein GXY76_20830 [Chloroflexi bacterium]|nr:hypothetical protein [Chloroflexota bacterium]
MPSVPAVQIDQMPGSVESFVTLRDRIAATPQGGAAAMIVALHLYAQDASLGQACLAVAVDASRLQEGAAGYQGWQMRLRELQLIRSQLAQQPYLPQSYLGGTAPEKGYALPPAPYTITFSANPLAGDPDAAEQKLFVVCSGASKPRPVTLRRDARGIWKALEWSSLIMGIVPAPKAGAPAL